MTSAPLQKHVKARVQRVGVFNFGTDQVRVLEKTSGSGTDWIRVLAQYMSGQSGIIRYLKSGSCFFQLYP